MKWQLVGGPTMFHWMLLFLCCVYVICDAIIIVVRIWSQ